METQLQGSHRRTFDAIFQHPVARNLAWRDVRTMLEAMTGVVLREEHEGTLRVSRNGRTLLLHRPPRKHISDVQELMDLRRFLEQSASAVPQPCAHGLHLLVVIDHRLARIYKAQLHGSLPERVLPYDQSGAGRHLHYVEDDSNGQRKPELKSFYEAVAKTLGDAEQILLFGSGTGASSAMEQLLAELKRHHKELAELVVGAVVVDQPQLTEDQLLAKAREFYAKTGSEQTTRLPGQAGRTGSMLNVLLYPFWESGRVNSRYVARDHET